MFDDPDPKMDLLQEARESAAQVLHDIQTDINNDESRLADAKYRAKTIVKLKRYRNDLLRSYNDVAGTGMRFNKAGFREMRDALEDLIATITEAGEASARSMHNVEIAELKSSIQEIIANFEEAKTESAEQIIKLNAALDESNTQMEAFKSDVTEMRAKYEQALKQKQAASSKKNEKPSAAPQWSATPFKIVKVGDYVEQKFEVHPQGTAYGDIVQRFMKMRRYKPDMSDTAPAASAPASIPTSSPAPQPVQPAAEKPDAKGKKSADMQRKQAV